MKAKLLLILLLTFSISAFSQNAAFEDVFIETVKKEDLIKAKTVGEIIPKYPTSEYSKTIDYVSVEILATCGGRSVRSLGKSDELSAEQKDLLNKVDTDTNVGITIHFTYKDPKNNDLGGNNKTKEMSYMITVAK